MVLCFICLTEIEGGVFIERPELNKKIYFCSLKCSDKYKEKE